MAFLTRLFAQRPGILRIASAIDWVPPTLARLILGWIFLLSGWGKLHGLDDVVDFFRSLGIPAPEIQAPFASTVEFVCGALLLAGLLTRFAAVPLMIVMTVAILAARREEVTSLGALFGFIEFTYIALLLYLAIGGPGPLSLDALLLRRAGGKAADPGTRGKPSAHL
jgi:putative oxidoreductase